jgi:putative ABC transport system substrate-binding protein
VRQETRRQFVQGASTAALGLLAGCGRLPWQLQAQQPSRVFRIGFLSGDPASPTYESFRQGLRDLGYTEGQNLIIEYRFAEGSEDRYPALAAELVSLGVDVILVVGQGVFAARSATASIPIVMAGTNDPVGSGIVASLARPGGNVTGLSLLVTQVSGKRLELLREVVPGASRIAVLWYDRTPALLTEIREIESAARILGVQLVYLPVKEPDDFERAFEAATAGHAEALFTVLDSFTFTHRARLTQLTAARRLPAIYELRQFVDAGGLMSYGASVSSNMYRAAYYVDRILKGAKPADLPVEQPREFELVINLKTAQALGLTIPEHVLLQATEVVQ